MMIVKILLFKIANDIILIEIKYIKMIVEFISLNTPASVKKTVLPIKDITNKSNKRSSNVP